MDSFGAVRALAREKHILVRAEAGGDASAAALLVAARKLSGAKTQAVPPQHPLLGGGDGALHRTQTTTSIYVSSKLSPDRAAYVEAHEFGHFWIETPGDPVIVASGSDPGAPEEPTPLGLRRVEGYSAQELRERYANVFSREFLLPASEARRRFVDDKRSATDIATDVGVPLGLVHQQLATALLLPESAPISETLQPSEKPGLDDSQRAAAEHQGSPLLVEAGPGTGKTRTLIARIEHLVGTKTPPAAILALTFSNKAAREIRERVAASAPDAAAEIWAGTFHAFGLEIVRKYGHLVGIAQPVRLLDQADQLAFLERELPALGLDHYLRLHEPLLELRNILVAISRAKDEVFSPAAYKTAAARMLDAAHDDKERLKAEKASEVAGVYEHYDRRLRESGLVDFADLINRPLEILAAHPDVRDELRAQYQHVLVDEYQDVNRASALLLKALVGEGDRLWAVGDARQSIYRFRGASPVNTRDFEKDYPTGVRKALDVNYRSNKQIVDTFVAYGNEMRVGKGRRLALDAKRGPGAAPVDFNVASDRAAEIVGIAEKIKSQAASGIAYRDQAVLCRSHGNLEKIALGLEALGVPVLYLGDLFERPEVRDLLALLSFVAEPHRGGLYRVAGLAPYQTPLPDVRALLAHAQATDQTPLAALADLDSTPGLSAEGVLALRRLRDDLAAVDFKTGPGAFLCEVLFNRGALLRMHLTGDSAADQQRRLAIHQFLQFAIENDTPGEGDPKRRLLGWVRRLEIFGDERALRDPPTAIHGIDAVRLMTVHASKGLEFKVVQLPTLGSGIFPLRWRGERCPAPLGMLPTSPADDQKEEEECLVFVALSRARDHLSLSRAQRYTAKQGSNASDALKTIARHLPRAFDGPPTWTGRLPEVADLGQRADLKVSGDAHEGRDIEIYLDCPRRYLYQVVLGLSGSREDNGYVRFHRAVYRVLRWMNGQGGTIDASAMSGEFESAWSQVGPFDHPLQALYRAAATRILQQAIGRSRIGISFGDIVEVEIAGARISLPIDELEHQGAGFTVRRLRTGRPPQTRDQRVLHALMAEACRQKHGEGGRFEIQYLTTNEAVDVPLDGVMADRLDATRGALAGLAAGAFPATPSDREACPRCPQYFICSAVPT